MMQHLEEHEHFLHLLANTHPKQRKALLTSASHQQLSILSEIIHNFLQGVIPADATDIERFSKSRNILRRLGQKNKKARRVYAIKHAITISHFLQTFYEKVKS